MKASSITVQSQDTVNGLSFNAFRMAVVGLVLLGTGILLIATRWGIGIYTDSIVYIGAARSIVAGEGFRFYNDVGAFTPITQYPPGFPWLIATFARVGWDALEAARRVSIFFCAANGLLVAYIVFRATCSRGATMVAAFLSMGAFPMIYVNSQALSEPSFIFLTLLGLCFLARYLQESHAASIYWFALCVGLSCLVRYVGIAFGLTGAAIILFHGRDTWRTRFVHGATFSTLSALPLVAWVLRNYTQAGNAVNRTFGFHLPSFADLLPSVDTVANWLLPSAAVENGPLPSRMLLLIALLVFCWLAIKMNWSRSWYPRLLVYCVAGYGTFLFISFSFNDQPLYFDTRTMALPYVATMMVVLTILSEWLKKNRSQQKSWRWFAFDCLVIIVLGVQLVNGAVWLRKSYLDGIGFAIESWRKSELLAFAKSAMPPYTVISNAPDFIYSLTGKRAFMIPHKIDPDTRVANPRYDEDIVALRERLTQPNTVLIYFKDEDRLWYLPSINDLTARLPLHSIMSASDGTIYRLQNSSSLALR
jgi:hypothetical protein